MGETDHENVNLERLWLEDDHTVKVLLREEGVAGYFANLENGGSGAFDVCNVTLGCIDEGVDGDLNLAGSGILMLDIEVKNGELKLISAEKLKKILLKMKNAGLRTITSHQGCGAMGLFAKKHNVTSEKAIGFGSQTLQALTLELGLTYQHINASEMHRPAELHTARVIYVDGTGHFNPYAIGAGHLPQGFSISRKFTDAEYALEEIKISLDIAFDDQHGFGKKFTKETPLIIIAIGGDESKGEIPLETLMAELQDGLDGSEYAGRFKIDGLEAPKVPKRDVASDW